MYNARGRLPNTDGTLWDPVSYMQKNWKRLVGWHVKDAVRAATPVAPPGNPFDQTEPVRPRRHSAVARPGLDPRVWGFRREFTEIVAKPREGLQVPHRGVRLRPRRRRRPGSLAAAREVQRQAATRAEVMRPLRVVLAVVTVLLALPAGAARMA